jgi:hypothetical protein
MKNISNSVSSLDNFTQAISETRLLCSCGGPYECTEWVKPVTIEYAWQKINRSVLDLQPAGELDKILMQASKCINRELTDGFITRFISSFLWYGKKKELVDAQKTVKALISTSIERNAMIEMADTAGKKAVLEEYLGMLFEVIVGLVMLNLLEDWPELYRATQAVLCGFLPVEVKKIDEQRKLLLY